MTSRRLTQLRLTAASLALAATPWLPGPAHAITAVESRRMARLVRDLPAGVGCATCLTDPPTAADCAGWEEKLDRVYCDKENTVVNPFMLLRGFKQGTTENKVPLRCRLYLLEKAHLDAESVVESRHLTGASRNIVEFAGSLHFLARNGALRWGAEDPDNDYADCPVSEAVSRLSGQVAEALAANFRQGTSSGQPMAPNGDSDLTNEFCAAVSPACQLMGGAFEVEPTSRKRVCRRGGIIIDRSCLELGTEKRKKIARSLGKVAGQGAECLFNDFRDPRFGQGAARAGQTLADHLNSPEEIRTQVCCGDDGCRSNVRALFGPYEPLPRTNQTVGSMAAVAYYTNASDPSLGRLSPGEEPDGNRRGIVEIPDRGMDPIATPGDTLGATLFHEFLHRIGLPTCPHHNYPSAPILPINGTCPARGYRAVDGQCVTDDACLRSSRDQSIFRYDAVYACSLACFPGVERGYPGDPVRDTTEQDRADAREICGRYAGHGNFEGASTISNLPAGPFGSAGQESNLCTFWSGR